MHGRQRLHGGGCIAAIEELAHVQPLLASALCSPFPLFCPPLHSDMNYLIKAARSVGLQCLIEVTMGDGIVGGMVPGAKQPPLPIRCMLQAI